MIQFFINIFLIVPPFTVPFFLFFSWILIYEAPDEQSTKPTLKSLSKKEYFYIVKHTNNIA